jgi:micrococcal nuclease
MRAKDRAAALLAGRMVTFRRVGRSYNRIVATVVLDSMISAPNWCRSAWRPRGRPKQDWCRRAS